MQDYLLESLKLQRIDFFIKLEATCYPVGF